MSIIRIAKTGDYTVISNWGANDKLLSWKAKGLLYYLLTKPDNWTISRASLVKESPDGDTAVRSALSELEERGYLVRARKNMDDGTFVWESTVHEKPQQPLVGFPPMVYPPMDNPPVDKPPVDNTPLINTEVTNTEVTNTPLPPKGERQGVSREFLDEFQAVWEKYPKKSAGMSISRKAAHKLSHEEWETAKISLPAWCAHWEQMAREGRSQFIPHLSTFLNQKRFESMPDGSVPKKGGSVAASANANRFTKPVYEEVVQCPDGSLAVYRSDRAGAPPIIIIPEEVKAYLARRAREEVESR